MLTLLPLYMPSQHDGAMGCVPDWSPCWSVARPPHPQEN